MPSDWLYIDTNFPSFTGEENLEQRVKTMQNYLYMLVEQFRYTLRNLDLTNMNAAAVSGFTNSITEPIYARIADDEGHLAQMQLDAQGLALRVSDAEGNISTLSQTSTAMQSQITNLNGDVSTLQQTATSLTSRISNAEGNISTLSQTVDSITLSVSNGTDSSVIKLMVDGVAVSSKTISFSGVVTFTDLETEGATTIYGGNIDTTTLKVSNLYGQYVYLRNSSGVARGLISITGASTASTAVDIESYGALRLTADYGNAYMESGDGTFVQLSTEVILGGGDARPNKTNTYSCGTSTALWSDVYASNGTIQTSDLTKKNSVVYGLDGYDAFFDSLKPMSFLFNEGTSGRRHLGLGSQDVERELSDCALSDMDFAGFIKSPRKNEDGETVEGEYDYALRYTEFIPLLIEQVQKLKSRVSELEARL